MLRPRSSKNLSKDLLAGSCRIKMLGDQTQECSVVFALSMLHMFGKIKKSGSSWQKRAESAKKVVARSVTTIPADRGRRGRPRVKCAGGFDEKGAIRNVGVSGGHIQYRSRLRRHANRRHRD